MKAHNLAESVLGIAARGVIDEFIREHMRPDSDLYITGIHTLNGLIDAAMSAAYEAGMEQVIAELEQRVFDFKVDRPGSINEWMLRRDEALKK